MLTFQVTGLTPHNNTVPITGMLEALVSELRVLRRLNDRSPAPIVVELASDYGRVKCSVANPKALAQSLESAPHANGGKELMVGYYVPTAAFLEMGEHTAVMDTQQQLVATCGPAGDPDSARDACLFAISPKLYAMCEKVLHLAIRGESVEELVPDLQALLNQVPKQPSATSSRQMAVFE